MNCHCQYGSGEARELLAANGIDDLEAAFQAGENLDELHDWRANRHVYKCVARFDLKRPSGAVRTYIKRQWKRSRIIPRWTELRHRIALKCSPIHEWCGLRTLKELGLYVAEPLALFWQGWGLHRGAIITQAVPPTFSLADMIQRDELQSMAADCRKSLYEACVDVISRMHRARISWRSMKAKHFYPEAIAPGQWRIWLIDCEGVYRNASRRDRQREWNEFLRTVASGVPPARHSLEEAYRRKSNGTPRN